MCCCLRLPGGRDEHNIIVNVYYGIATESMGDPERQKSPEVVDGANYSNQDLKANKGSKGLGVQPPENQPKSLPLPLSNDRIGGIGGGGGAWRFGELIEAPKEASRRIPPARILGEPAFEGDGGLLGL